MALEAASLWGVKSSAGSSGRPWQFCLSCLQVYKRTDLEPKLTSDFQSFESPCASFLLTVSSWCVCYTEVLRGRNETKERKVSPQDLPHRMRFYKSVQDQGCFWVEDAPLLVQLCLVFSVGAGTVASHRLGGALFWAALQGLDCVWNQLIPNHANLFSGPTVRF